MGDENISLIIVRMAKTKVSISLIKKGLSENDVVEDGALTMELPNGMKLYYKNNPASNPKWAKSFFNDDLVLGDRLKTQSVSALILYNVEVTEEEYRYFVITFGYGRNLLNNNVIEERFGLLVTLNVVDSNHLRSIDVNSLESVPLKNRIQSSALAGISNFNIDIDRDFLKAVTGKSSIDSFDGTLSGSDTLSVSTDKQYDDIQHFLKECYLYFVSDKYKDDFDWVDHMNVVKDADLIAALDQEMINNLNSENTSLMWVSIPEIIDWSGDIRISVKTTQFDDIDISDLKSLYEMPFTIDILKTQRVSIVDSNDNKLKTWPLYKCIYADLEYNDKQYLLNEGKWFILENNFVKMVKNYYEESAVFMGDLPVYDVKDEKQYNEKIEALDKSNYFLMDRKLILLGGDTIEFCDVYSKEKKFIHVKNFKGSAVLSHLFYQGLVSAESFFDKEFRNKVNEKFERGFSVSSETSISPTDYEVVYVIAKKNSTSKSLPDIPFFSKVSFRNASKRLLRYGYKVSITAVPFTYSSNV